MDKTEKNDLKGFAFLRSEVLRTGVTPSLREIGRAVGYSSPRSVQLMLARLQRRGLLSYDGGVVRLSLTKARAVPEQTIDVPLVGSVACGLPSLAEQDHEALVQISTKIARPGSRYFMLRACGSSMNKSGIQDGDLVLVRQQPDARDGEKVVALINEEATIKHFHRERNVVVLKPNSTDRKHKPIILSDEFAVQGVVVATLSAKILEP